MLRVDFGGADRLIPILDEAARQATCAATAQHVKDGLRDLINDGAIELPDSALEPGDDTYGRHLLYRSDEYECDEEISKQWARLGCR